MSGHSATINIILSSLLSKTPYYSDIATANIKLFHGGYGRVSMTPYYRGHAVIKIKLGIVPVNCAIMSIKLYMTAMQDALLLWHAIMNIK